MVLVLVLLLWLVVVVVVVVVMLEIPETARALSYPRTSITATLHYTATWYQTAPAAAKAMQGDWQLAVSVSPEVRKTKARIWG